MQAEGLKRRQRSAVERSGEGGAAGFGNLVAHEKEHLELLQPSRRTRRRRRRRYEGGEALVAKRVVFETENLQRVKPPQDRREGHLRA